MNILRFVYEYPFPWDGLTPGPYELSKAQVEIGNKVFVFCGGWPTHRTYIDKELRVSRLPISLPKFSLFLTTAPALLCTHLLSGIRRKTDVVHSHGHIGFFYYLYHAITGRKRKIPLIFHLHITAAGREEKIVKQGGVVDFGARNFEWKLHKLSDKVGCSVADAIICSSTSVKDEAVRFYNVNSEKIHVIPNGVNIRRFKPDGSNVKDKFNLKDSTVILYIGGINPRKNVDILIESLKYLPNSYKLMIVGRYDLRYYSVLKILIQQLELNRRVIFAGYVPYPELPPYYRAANVFVLPSSYEGFPKVILESLASGIPVISSKSFVGDQSIIKHLVIIEKNTPQEIAKTVRKVTESELKVGVEEIKERYDWKVIARQIQKVYEAVL